MNSVGIRTLLSDSSIRESLLHRASILPCASLLHRVFIDKVTNVNKFLKFFLKCWLLLYVCLKASAVFGLVIWVVVCNLGQFEKQHHFSWYSVWFGENINLHYQVVLLRYDKIHRGNLLIGELAKAYLECNGETW